MCFRSDLVLFDFKNREDESNWVEVSDSMRPDGKLSADFGYYMTALESNAHFDSYLTPKMSGPKCYCGFRTNVNFNLDGYDYLYFKCVARGDADTYRIILGHGNLNHSDTRFMQKFKVCLATFTMILLFMYSSKSNKRYIYLFIFFLLIVKH